MVEEAFVINYATDKLDQIKILERSENSACILKLDTQEVYWIDRREIINKD